MLVSFKPFALAGLCVSLFVSATFGHVTKDPKTLIVKAPKTPIVKEPKIPLVFQECKKPHQFATLFIDGPYTYSKDIGELFKRKGVEGKATFFINGNNYGCIYDKENVNALRARYHEGFEFGSLTWSHVDLVNLSSAQVVKQLELLETAVERILGVRLGLITAPYDIIDEKAVKVIRDKGYKIVRWSLDSGDTTFYLGRPQSSVNLIRKWIKTASGKSAIGLFDETKADTVHKVLPHSIDLLKKSGYKLVTLSECLGVEPYQKGHFHRSERDKTWTCAGTPAPGSN